MIVARLCLLRVLPVVILVLVAIKASGYASGRAESPRRVAERRSIELDPDTITTRILLAVMLQETGHLREAATVADDVVRRDPDNVRARALQSSIRKATGGS